MQEEEKLNTENTINESDDTNNLADLIDDNNDMGDEPIAEFIELGDDGEEMDGNGTVKKLRDKIKKLEIEKAEYLNSWQRTLADYKNREMGIAKERPEWGKMAIRSFAEDLLIVMDTYDAAKSNVSAWEMVDANWRSGIEYIFNTFENKLKEQGFEKFGAVGDVFDPNVHEGLGTVKISSDDQSAAANAMSYKENTIAQLIMSGYKYNGKVIRPAKVKVYSAE